MVLQIIFYCGVLDVGNTVRRVYPHPLLDNQTTLLCYNLMRNLIIKFLIKYLSKELSDIPKVTLEKEQYDGLLSQLWQSPAFRKYLADRDSKLVWTLAGGEGLEPEPRDKYALHSGQRFEILLLGREAKAAWNRTEQERLKKQEKVVP